MSINPLDYHNPQRRTGDESSAKAPRAVIPLEFDVVIARTQDQAAATAIEQQLGREHIPVYRTHEGPIVNQQIDLLVRTADRERASVIAHSILSRRQKLKSFPRQGVR